MSENPPQSRTELRELLSGVGHIPNKHLGQNFLVDQNIVHKIMSVARLDATSNVVEIGAGTGVLTVALADKAGSIVAYEVDPDLESVLLAVVGDRPNVEVRIADAAKVRLDDELTDATWTMISNLPYNVGTGIVLDALRGAPKISAFVVMVQREVADRMLAEPGSKVYGLPSVVVGLHAKGFLAFTVPAHAFEPQPKVESGVVVLERIAPDVRADRAISLATAAFSQRRKMVRGSMASVLADPSGTIAAAGLDPTLRAEDLSPSDYVAIAHAEGRS